MTPLRSRRETLRVPKRELAVRLGLHPYELSRLESGSVAPAVATLQRAAMLLSTDPRALGAHECACGCGQLAAPGRRWVHGHATTRGERGKQWKEKRREQAIPETKTCEGCGGTYTRRKRENTRKWLKRRWCSAACWRASPLCRTPPHQRQWGSVS